VYVYRYICLSIYDALMYIFSGSVEVNILESEKKQYWRISKFAIREKIFKVFYSPRFFILDFYETISRLNFDNTISDVSIKTLPRIFYRIKNYEYSPYNQFYNNISLKEFIKTYSNTYLYGFRSFWLSIRGWIISLMLAGSSLYFLSYIRVLPVNTVLFQWFALAMFAYWLLSGFVFFIKKYQFTRFTSAIQRFWRRSYILFWLIESCLLIVFFYLTINASQESIYMLDQVQVFKTHLFSWKSFLPKLYISTFLIILGYLTLLNIKWNFFKKQIPFIISITVLLTYMLWIEFYQIYHVSNFYSNLFWSYDVEEKLWSLESDVRRTRIVNHYVMILFILKFWHIVFIYGFWIFLVLRANELSRVRYPLYSANFQNFIILYIMSWLFMYPWLKFAFHRFLEVPYFWFYVNNRKLGLRVLVNDIKLVFYGLIDIFNHTPNNFFKTTNFIYWIINDENTNYYSFRKHTIRNSIIMELTK